MTIKEHFEASAAAMARVILNEGRLAATVEAAGLNDVEASYISTNNYTTPPEVIVQFYSADESFRDASRRLVHASGKVDKRYDEIQKELSLSGMVAGVRIVLKSAPPSTCTVEKVVEEVEVAEVVTPAHTEKRVRYVMKGDCNPMMAPTGNQVDAVVDGAVAAADTVGVTRG